MMGAVKDHLHELCEVVVAQEQGREPRVPILLADEDLVRDIRDHCWDLLDPGREVTAEDLLEYYLEATDTLLASEVGGPDAEG